MKKSASKKEVGLSAAPYAYGQLLKAFFKGDRRYSVGDVRYTKHKGKYIVDIRANDADACDALDLIIDPAKGFGKLTLTVRVIPANEKVKKGLARRSDVSFTFEGAVDVVLGKNPAFKGIERRKAPGGQFVFAIFKPQVLQYMSDNIGNPWKLSTTVHEDAARSIFRDGMGILMTTQKA